jgi:hypothetical protein
VITTTQRRCESHPSRDTAPGKSVCESCLERSRRNGAKRREHARATGTCLKCKAPATGTFCDEHRKEYAAQQRERRIDFVRIQCGACGVSHRPGVACFKRVG